MATTLKQSEADRQVKNVCSAQGLSMQSTTCGNSSTAALNHNIRGLCDLGTERYWVDYCLRYA